MCIRDSLEGLRADLAARSTVPNYVWAVLGAMPADSHPMCLFSTGILCMEGESVFRTRYDNGLRKEDFWEPTLDDALNIIARVPVLAAGIYRKKFNKGARINPNPTLDWGANYAHMLGIADPKGEFTKLLHLYLVLHSDHENGNVSAMSTFTVNSALSDLYYSFSGTMLGAFVLAGPDAGSLEISVDGGEWRKIDLFHSFSKSLNYPRSVILADDLSPTGHQAVIRVADAIPEGSQGSTATILYFEVNG